MAASSGPRAFAPDELPSSAGGFRRGFNGWGLRGLGLETLGVQGGGVQGFRGLGFKLALRGWTMNTL